MTRLKSETLDTATNLIKEQHINPLTARVEILEQFNSDFTTKICGAITESTTIQNAIKKLVWQTVKDKVIWLILGALITLGIAFFQGYFSQLGKTVFDLQKQVVTQQGQS